MFAYITQNGIDFLSHIGCPVRWVQQETQYPIEFCTLDSVIPAQHLRISCSISIIKVYDIQGFEWRVFYHVRRRSPWNCWLSTDGSHFDTINNSLLIQKHVPLRMICIRNCQFGLCVSRTQRPIAAPLLVFSHYTQE